MDLTVTAIQWGAEQNIHNISNYCGSVAHVGDVLTLDGVGTCATSDVHEFCNQQFTLTANGSLTGGNLMRIHSTYQGGTGSPVPGISFVEPGTQMPAPPNTYWDSSEIGQPVLLSVQDPYYGYRIGPDYVANYLSPYIGSGQETAMDANAGVAPGFGGFGIQVGFGQYAGYSTDPAVAFYLGWSFGVSDFGGDFGGF